jgi:hypothetical protein
VESQGPDPGSIFIGVAERQQDKSYGSWRDYGFVSYSVVVASHHGGEQPYGPFYWPTDTIGVLLNMDEVRASSSSLCWCMGRAATVCVWCASCDGAGLHRLREGC